MVSTSPRIYVASLADYNAGRLYGRWIDAAQDADDIHAEVVAMLAESREPIAEEWAIHDYDGFDGLSLGEYESFERVSEIALAIEEHGPAVAAFMSLGITDDVSAFEDYYAGEWDSEEAYAWDFLEDTGTLSQIPEDLQAYFDISAYTRDLFMDYSSVKTPDYNVWVFRDNA